MSSDLTNETLILKDGRNLGLAEYGSAAGRPVFHFHGAGSSRFERPPDENMLCQLDVRLIAVDRPGHGLSDYQPRRRLLDWPQDVCQLANHLGIGPFYVEGYSSGGPYALACAYQLSERVIAGAAFGCVAPMDRPGAYQGLPFFNQVLAKSARRFPIFTFFIRWMMRGMVIGDVEKASRQLMSSIPAADKAVLYSPQVSEIFVRSVREGFRPGSRGVAWDDILINQDWGFDPAKIGLRIDLWQGDADVNVPVHAARYLCGVIPHAWATILPGKGHFFLFSCWPDVLLDLTSGN